MALFFTNRFPRLRSPCASPGEASSNLLHPSNEIHYRCRLQKLDSLCDDDDKNRNDRSVITNLSVHRHQTYLISGVKHLVVTCLLLLLCH